MNMNDESPPLVDRYFSAERLGWIGLSILSLINIFGAPEKIELPAASMEISGATTIAKALILLVAASNIWLSFEWLSSEKSARHLLINRIRLAASFVTSASIIIWTTKVQFPDTEYSRASLVSLLFIAVISLVISLSVTILSTGLLMIRSKSESEVLGLRRLPLASVAILRSTIPIILVSALIYFSIMYFGSRETVNVGALVGSLTYLAVILFSAHDIICAKSGPKRLGYRDNISAMRKAWDAHETVIRNNMLISPYARVISPVPQNYLDNIQKQQRAESEQKETIEEESFNIVLREELPFIWMPRYESGGVVYTGTVTPPPDGRLFIKAEIHFPSNPSQNRLLNLDINDLRNRASLHKLDNLPDASSMRNILNDILNSVGFKAFLKEQPELLIQWSHEGIVDAVRFAISCGANLNSSGTSGWTALLYSAADQNLEITKILLSAGADPNVRNLLGRSPLAFAARYGNLEIVKLLIEYGADVNCIDVQGETPLISASGFGHEECCRFLLENGANPSQKNLAGHDALYFAQQNGHGEIAKLLRAQIKSSLS